MLTKSWKSFPLGRDLHPIALNGIKRSYIIDKTDKCNKCNSKNIKRMIFRSINPPIPMLLYVWEQESCTKVIPINVLSPQHGYLQPSRSKIAQSKRCTSLEETRNTHLVTRARIEKRVQERLCRKFRIEPRIGDAPVFPFCRIFFTCATSLLFPARQLHRVLCRVTVARRTRTEHSHGAMVLFRLVRPENFTSLDTASPRSTGLFVRFAFRERGSSIYSFRVTLANENVLFFFPFFFFRQFLVTTKDSSLWRGLVCPRIYFDFSALLTALENSIALSTGLTNDWSLFAANETEWNLFSGEFIALRLISMLKGARQGLNTVAVTVN